jgi:hypothetical protein
MSSSISTSDTPREWGRWLVTFFGALGLGATLAFVFVLAVDPYDSGRFGWLGIKSIGEQGPRTENASRARDPQFDSAVIGNSTGMLLKPSELSRATDAHFVQLTVYGTRPREQLSILNFFVRNHSRIRALVIVADDPSWCTRDATLPLQHPFPFWIYDANNLEYAARLFSARALGHAWQRVMLALGFRKPVAPDGYSDYELIWFWEFRGEPTLQTSPERVGSTGDVFPAVALLNTAIRKISVDTAVILVVPPVFYKDIPQPGSSEATEREACDSQLKRLVSGRPRSKFINFRIDTALTRDPANFLNAVHYRGKIARKMEEGIVESIRFGETANIDF